MKAGVSLSSVKRALKGLAEAGILTIHPFTHTKRGGKTHNIYVIILARWKTVCVAAKRSGLSSKTAKLDSIRQAWKDVVNFYKRGKIKNSTDDGIGGYFYSVLCDYLLDDCLRSLAM